MSNSNRRIPEAAAVLTAVAAVTFAALAMLRDNGRVEPAPPQSVRGPGLTGNDMISFRRDAPGVAGSLYLVKPDGSRLRGIFRETSLQPTALEWSPDGTRVVFVGNRTGKEGIYVMDADGTNSRWLTHSTAEDNPAWSPDGLKISFSRTRNNKEDVYVMGADGTGVRKLTEGPAESYSPDWSPDGSKITFVRNLGYPNEEIYLVSPRGGRARRLTHNPLNDNSPSWSPDGSRIAFGSFRGGTWNIYVMNRDGSQQRPLTRQREGANVFPAWSPDGSSIAFSGYRAGNYDVYVMNADGTGVSRLTDDPAWDGDVAWRRIA